MGDRAQQLWQHILSAIQSKLTKPTFDAWFSKTKALQFDESRVVISTENQLHKEWLQEKYMNLICSTIQEITEYDAEIVIISEEDERAAHLDQVRADAIATPQSISGYSFSPIASGKEETDIHEPYSSMLNPKYTFDTFVEGAGNRFAYAAALAVADDPAKNYNPLFLYGGVGLGKTHLMQAIAHHIIKHNPSTRVLYISSEKFTNEFINAIHDKTMDQFHRKYRNIDVLLIDDIQFLAGKEQTQEEFFHTFNTLHEAHKQIVISSDRPPKEIRTLEERLRSRFEWGLITDIQPPDLETRIAILRKKAKAENLEIPNDTITYIASQIDSNIRELEGALIRVIAYSSLVNEDISVHLAAEALKNIIPSSRNRMVTIQDIQQKVARRFDLKPEEMKARKRTKEIALARQVAMYLSRELTDHSLPKIGQEFGGRDHTTVIHAHEKISELIQTDHEIKTIINQLIHDIKNPG